MVGDTVGVIVFVGVIVGVFVGVGNMMSLQTTDTFLDSEFTVQGDSKLIVIFFKPSVV
jgi:hypothetical protein